MERTLLINGRFPGCTEPAMVVFNHISPDTPPDPIGFAGLHTDPQAPDLTAPGDEDAVLDLEGALLLPGLIDLDIGLDTFADTKEPFDYYRAYRLAADALYRGVLSAGITRQGPILSALTQASRDYTLWTPGIHSWDPEAVPEDYAVFRGAPAKGTKEESDYLAQVRAARLAGKKPAAATGRSPRDLVEGLYPLVRAAVLITEGGYSPREALEAITVNNAYILGITQATGRLQTGLEGDVVAAPAEAAEDPAQLQNMTMTARGGRLIWIHMNAMDRIRFCTAPPGCE